MPDLAVKQVHGLQCLAYEPQDIPMKTLMTLLALCLISMPLAAQPIYKIVDEHGNITYTDQKPSDNAEPMRLPEINVVQGEEAEIPIPEASERDDAPAMNFRIVSPDDQEHIFSAEDTLTVTLDSDIQIPPTAQIVIFINDTAQPPIHSMSADFQSMEPGENTVRAELQTAAGRVLATTDAVTFYMGQTARLNPD
ncbi:MAG: DUF4124 domain-containing protein [Wenzhouxiangella sp.]|nr:MAG: DUF4124 domain-containing protein [Wenzhouxiangella sp.]